MGFDTIEINLLGNYSDPNFFFGLNIFWTQHFFDPKFFGA